MVDLIGFKGRAKKFGGKVRNAYQKSKSYVNEKIMSIIGIGLAVFVFIWSWVMSGSDNGIWLAIINGLMVVSAIIWKFPFSVKTKFIGTLLLFSPLIGYSIYYSMTVGGALFGNLIDQAQHALTSSTSNSPSVIDMILNPKLAIQAGMKPPSQKEVSESSNPSLSFEVSGESIPSSGCYDSTNFQVIARVKNVGTNYIKDLLLTVRKSDDNPSACNSMSFSGDHEWKITSLPVSVTSTHSVLVNPIPVPSLDNAGDNIASSHSCFVTINAETGYHGFTRLPLEFIESVYARSLYERGLLKQSVVKSVTSVGPVDLSIGGLSQPIYNAGENDLTLPLITSFSNNGEGFVKSYESVFLLIPTTLLSDGDCAGDGDSWECINSVNSDGTINCGSLSSGWLNSNNAVDLCNNLNTFIRNGGIGGYAQFDYDNVADLLNNGYSICFYKNDISVDDVNTGICTLSVDVNHILSGLRRSTLIIRGDILYVYDETDEVSFSVKDCDVT